LNLGLSEADAGSIDKDILLPAFESALSDLLKERPDLAAHMPEMPTSLQSAIDQVVLKMGGTSSVDEAGK